MNYSREGNNHSVNPETSAPNAIWSPNRRKQKEVQEPAEGEPQYTPGVYVSVCESGGCRDPSGGVDPSGGARPIVTYTQSCKYVKSKPRAIVGWQGLSKGATTTATGSRCRETQEHTAKYRILRGEGR